MFDMLNMLNIINILNILNVSNVRLYHVTSKIDIHFDRSEFSSVTICSIIIYISDISLLFLIYYVLFGQLNLK